MQLSERLNTIIDMADPCVSAADIGTDHGFVPIALIERGKAERALACDVRKGPLDRAKEHVKEAGLDEKIECRLGDGLQCLKPGDAELIIIAGMGGTLISEILKAGAAVLLQTKELILSPHTDAPEVRRRIACMGFAVTEERMLEEEGKFYTVIKAEKKELEEWEKPTAQEILFGPCLLRDRPPVFVKWLNNEARKDRELIENLKKEAASDAIIRRITEKENELFMIETVLGGQK